MDDESLRMLVELFMDLSVMMPITALPNWKFKVYLYGAKFEILTDNNPLCCLQSTSKLGAVEQRWAAQLAMYNFEIKYRTGKTNQAADALSRLPRQGTEIPAKVFYDHIRRSYADFKWTQQHDCGL